MLCRLLLAAVLVAVPRLLSAQDSPEPALRFGGIELTVGGRLQTQLNTTSVDDEQPSEIGIRRARIEVGVRVNDVVSGAIHPDFGNEQLDLKDAFVKLDFSPGLQILAGKAYRPFGLLENTSSKRILPIERGLRIRGLQAGDEYSVLSGLGYSNRDVGIQLLGAPEDAPMGFAYALGILRGPLHGDVGPQDSYQFAGRVTVEPLPSVRVGAGWSARHFAADASPEPDLDRGHAFEVDLEYGSFAPGLHLLAEVSRGDIDPFSGAEFWGAHGWLAFRSEPLSPAVTALEPVFRASHSRMNDDEAPPPVQGGTLLTPGINIYFGPLSRVMVNYDVWLGADASPDAQSFKMMFQLGF
jgi:hypothetical protein